MGFGDRTIMNWDIQAQYSRQQQLQQQRDQQLRQQQQMQQGMQLKQIKKRRIPI